MIIIVLREILPCYECKSYSYESFWISLSRLLNDHGKMRSCERSGLNTSESSKDYLSLSFKVEYLWGYSTGILEIRKWREAISPKIMGRNGWNFMWGCIKGMWVHGLIFKKIEATFFPSTKVSFFLIFAFIIIQHV